MKSNFAILILSCDKYLDLWTPFFKLFWKYWPDCPYPVYLGSNETKYSSNQKVKNILSGKDYNWSRSYKNILSQIPEENIFVWLEDAFFISKIDSFIFKKCFNFLKQKKINHIHYKPIPRPDNILNNDFGIYQKGMPYRVGTVGFWKKKYLKKLLMDGESPWSFEIMGSYRTSYDDGFYCILKPFIKYIHLVEKGSWLAEGLVYCKKNKINIDFNKRVESKLNFLNFIKEWYFKMIMNSSWKIRIRLMNLLRKLIVSY